MSIMPLTMVEMTAKCTPELIATRDEAAIAAMVNVGRVKVAKVAVLDVKAYLHTNNLWLSILSAQTDQTKSAYGRMAASALIAFAESGVANMDVTLHAVDMQLGMLVADGVIAEADKNAIIALGTVDDFVSAYDVALTLSGI